MAFDLAGNLLIADRLHNRVRKVDAATAIITTVAGNGSQGYLGDGGPATAEGLAWPAGLVLERFAYQSAPASGDSDVVIPIGSLALAFAF